MGIGGPLGATWAHGGRGLHSQPTANSQQPAASRQGRPAVPPPASRQRDLSRSTSQRPQKYLGRTTSSCNLCQIRSRTAAIAASDLRYKVESSGFTRCRRVGVLAFWGRQHGNSMFIPAVPRYLQAYPKTTKWSMSYLAPELQEHVKSAKAVGASNLRLPRSHGFCRAGLLQAGFKWARHSWP